MPPAELILIALLIAACVGGVFLTVLQLPGTWFIIAATAGYGWYDGWAHVGWKTVAVLAGVAVVAEVAEGLCAFWFARRGGASRRAAWYGLAGGLAGAFLLTVPVPIIGTVIGAAAGCFAGAMLGEMSEDRDAATGARVGMYAAAGRVLGTVLKLGAAITMAGVVVVSLLLL